MTDHVNLSDAELHEPKHIQTALGGDNDKGKVIKALGDGTSELARLSFSDLAENVAIVYVTDESDLPAPVAGVIDLGVGITYVFTQAFTLNSRLTYGLNTQLDGLNSGTTTVTYAGVQPLFTNNGASASLRADRLSVNAPNAALLSLTDAADSGSLRFESCTMTAASIGVLNNANIIQFNQTNLTLSTTGITFTGAINNPTFNFTNSQAFMAAGTFLDLTTTVMRGGRIEFAAIMETAAGVTGITALGGANVVSGSFFDVTEAAVQTTTALAGGVAPSSSRWTFSNVIGISDTRTACTAFLEVVETVTISTTNTFVPIAGGNWMNESLDDDFVIDGDGLITYNGERDVVMQFTATATLEKTGGGADFIAARIAKNGTTVVSSEGATDNATPAQVVSIALLSLVQGDTVQLYVANRDSTSNVIVDLAALHGVRVP